MNSGGDCGLEFRRNRFRFAQGLMEMKVSVGVGLKIAESGTFLLPLREAVATGKWRAALDSAHRIGVSTLSRGVLNVDEGVCGSWFKISRIGNVFASASRASGRTGKWRAALHSAH